MKYLRVKVDNIYFWVLHENNIYVYTKEDMTIYNTCKTSINRSTI